MSLVLAALAFACALSGVLPVRGEEGSDTVADTSAPAWTASLTVGQSGSDTSSLTVWGYSTSAVGMGQLSEDTFSSGDQTIEVKAVLLQAGHLLLSVLPEPAEGFVLDVDGTGFASADATLQRQDTLIGYRWATAELNWAEDDTVALSLSWVEAEDASAELGDEAKSQKAETVVVKDATSTPTPTPTPTPTAPPARPTGLSATASPGAIALSWDDPSDATITHYEVFRRDTTSHAIGEFITLEANTGSAATTYRDESVEPERKYVYRVKAVNAHGASLWSSFANATTPPAPVPPTAEDLAPSGLTATLPKGGGVSLSWTAPAEDADSVSGYEILRAVGDGELATLVADTSATATTYTDASATEAGETYAYQVKAIRGEDRSEASGEAEVQLPHNPVDLAPTGLNALTNSLSLVTADSSNPITYSVRLSWTAPTEDADSVSGYEILRAVGDGELATLVADTASTTTTYTDATASEAGESYAYEVKAIRGEGRSQASGQAQVQLPHDAVDLAPSGLTATLVEGGGVSLSWTAPAEDADSVSGYEIVRAVGDGEPATLVSDTGNTTTTYSDATATEAGETYAYEVKAIRGEERSQASAEASVALPAAAVATTCEFDAGGSDLPADTSTPCALEVGGSVRGERAAADDVDWYRVGLQALATYQFDMRGKSSGGWQLVDGAPAFVSVGTLEDPQLLGIYDASGALVAGTDSEVAGTGKDSRIASFRPDADGVYYISASAEGAWTGTYELSLTVTAGTHVEDLGVLAPSGLTVTLAEGGGYTLSWTVPAEEADSVTGYGILRAVGEGALRILVADTASSATTYTDASASQPGTSYAYRVIALRGGVKSQQSNEATADLPVRGGVQVTCPATDTACSGSGPADLAVTATASGLRLSWNPPPAPTGDGVETDVLQYQIMRSPGNDSYSLVTCVDADARSYLDATAEAGGQYRYQVRAIYFVNEACASLRDIDVDLTIEGTGYEPVDGLWSDGTTLWASDRSRAAILAFRLSDGVRDGSRDIIAEDNSDPRGLWGRDGTLWALTESGSGSTKITLDGYSLTEGTFGNRTARLTLGPKADDTGAPTSGYGLWADEDTFWISEVPSSSLFAYDWAESGTLARNTAQELSPGISYANLGISMWGDGTTMWMATSLSGAFKKVTAFDWPAGTADTSRDIALRSSATVGGMWSDGEIIWIASGNDDLHAYPLSTKRQHSAWAQSNRPAVVTVTPATAVVKGGGALSPSVKATDPDGDELTYAWTSSDSSTFADAEVASATWTAPAATSSDQTVTLTLTVTDAHSETATATVVVTVPATSSGSPFVSVTGTPAIVDGGEAVTLDGTASDPQTSETLSYAWTSSGGGTFADDEALDTTWTAPAATLAEQRITLTLTATDDSSSTNSATSTVVVIVRANRAPVVEVSPRAAIVSGPAPEVSLKATVTDHENDDLTYAWTSDGGGTFADAAAASTAWTAPAATNADQEITLTVTVTDAAGNVVSVAVEITRRANQPPGVAVTPGQDSIGGGRTLTLEATAVDPEEDDLTYAWSSDIGTFTDTESLSTSWTAPDTISDEEATLALTVTDAFGNSTTVTVVITVLANVPPIGPLNVVCASDDAECSGPGPRNVALSEVEGGLELSWEPPPAPTAEGAETDVHQYQILRAVGGTDFKVLACEPAESRSYLDAATEADKHYRYLVRAIYFANDACAALRDINVAVTIGGTDYRPVSGLWSDGTTLWASDEDEDRILAFNLADGARESGKDITAESGANPRGLWSWDGLLWAVTDNGDPHVAPIVLDGFP